MAPLGYPLFQINQAQDLALPIGKIKKAISGSSADVIITTQPLAIFGVIYPIQFALIPSALTQTTYYRMFVKSSCGTDSSNIKPVHIVPSPVASFTDTIKGNQVIF